MKYLKHKIYIYGLLVCPILSLPSCNSISDYNQLLLDHGRSENFYAIIDIENSPSEAVVPVDYLWQYLYTQSDTNSFTDILLREKRLWLDLKDSFNPIIRLSLDDLPGQEIMLVRLIDCQEMKEKFQINPASQLNEYFRMGDSLTAETGLMKSEVFLSIPEMSCLINDLIQGGYLVNHDDETGRLSIQKASRFNSIP
ncbi:MAG: hypothetical protein AAGM67_18655 [Bacteroidota bacterium]